MSYFFCSYLYFLASYVAKNLFMKLTEQEFSRIVKENKNAIYSACYMFSKDKDEVNDLFQEVLIKMWNGFMSYREDCPVSSWIWKISLNTCISYVRKKKSHPTVPISMQADFFSDEDANTKQIQALNKRIRKLGVMDRALILLWLDNMTYEEIAAIIGITPNNVSVKLVRIKEKLLNMKEE